MSWHSSRICRKLPVFKGCPPWWTWCLSAACIDWDYLCEESRNLSSHKPVACRHGIAFQRADAVHEEVSCINMTSSFIEAVTCISSADVHRLAKAGVYVYIPPEFYPRNYRLNGWKEWTPWGNGSLAAISSWPPTALSVCYFCHEIRKNILGHPWYKLGGRRRARAGLASQVKMSRGHGGCWKPFIMRGPHQHLGGLLMHASGCTFSVSGVPFPWTVTPRLSATHVAWPLIRIPLQHTSLLNWAQRNPSTRGPYL